MAKSFRILRVPRKKFSRNGAQLSEGDLWIQPDLAKTLVSISENGRDGFYDGEVASLLLLKCKLEEE